MEKSSGNPCVRQWCWTLNNPEKDPELSKWLDFLKEESKYTVFQPEEESTVHLQGYSEFKRKWYLTELKKVNNRVHLEPRKGTREEARNYCMKDESAIDDPIEFGEWKPEGGPGKAYHACLAAIKEGANLEEISEEFPDIYLKYCRGVKDVVNLRNKNLNGITMGEIEEKQLGFYISDGYIQVYYKEGRFFGLVEGAKKIILYMDDIPAKLWNRMKLGFPLSLPVMGGERRWSPTHVLIVQDGSGNTKAEPSPEKVVKKKKNKKLVLE